MLPAGVTKVALAAAFPLLPPPPGSVNGLTVTLTGPAQVALVKLSGALGLLLLRFAAAALPVSTAVRVSVPVMAAGLLCVVVAAGAELELELLHEARASASNACRDRGKRCPSHNSPPSRPVAQVTPRLAGLEWNSYSYGQGQSSAEASIGFGT